MRNEHYLDVDVLLCRSLLTMSRTRRAWALRLSLPYLDAYVLLDDFPEKKSSAHAQ